jgi:hypothetical protein
LRACGARPSAGGSGLGWPSGESPGITQKAIFSEGRTLCVRVARPCLCRGMSLVEMVGRKVRGVTGMCLVQAQACFDGRAEPAPPRGGLSKLERPCGESPEMAPKAVFSEGRTLCVRIAGPDVGGFPAPDSGIK